MRRIYHKKPARKQIQMEAMLNLKKARREIDPDLLESAQQAIAEAWFSRQNKEQAAHNSHMEPVDRKRNLSVIQKFVEMNRDNSGLQKQIKSILAEYS